MPSSSIGRKIEKVSNGNCYKTPKKPVDECFQEKRHPNPKKNLKKLNN